MNNHTILPPLLVVALIGAFGCQYEPGSVSGTDASVPPDASADDIGASVQAQTRWDPHTCEGGCNDTLRECADRVSAGRGTFRQCARDYSACSEGCLEQGGAPGLDVIDLSPEGPVVLVQPRSSYGTVLRR